MTHLIVALYHPNGSCSCRDEFETANPNLIEAVHLHARELILREGAQTGQTGEQMAMAGYSIRVYNESIVLRLDLFD